MPALLENIEAHLEGKLLSASKVLGEVTLEVSPENYHEVCEILASHQDFLFEQLVDLCGVDYSEHPDQEKYNKRFAVVVHLISYRKNMRVRVRVLIEDEDLPIVPTLTDIWKGANWFEREAFDLFGIIFEGHNDLRRILTDYGFIGHPFRKDFPVVGNVEMRYDPDQKRVIYEKVSIEERVVVPKVYR